MALPGVIAAKIIDHYAKDTELHSEPAGGASAADGGAHDALEGAFRSLAESILAAPQGAQGPGCFKKVVEKLSSYTSFAPMVVIGVVPDVRVGAVVAAAVAVFNVLASGALKATGVFKVWPKVFDIVNVCIYTTMAAVAYTHPRWTRLWLPLFTSALTANYFLASLIIRRPFCEELARESAPQMFWGNPAFKRLNLWISVAWTAALWVVALSALSFCLIVTFKGPDDLSYLILDVVLGIAPLILAMVTQHLLVFRFRRRVRAEVARLKAARGGAAAPGSGEAAV